MICSPLYPLFDLSILLLSTSQSFNGQSISNFSCIGFGVWINLSLDREMRDAVIALFQIAIQLSKN